MKLVKIDKNMDIIVQQDLVYTHNKKKKFIEFFIESNNIENIYMSVIEYNSKIVKIFKIESEDKSDLIQSINIEDNTKEEYENLERQLKEAKDNNSILIKNNFDVNMVKHLYNSITNSNFIYILTTNFISIYKKSSSKYNFQSKLYNISQIKGIGGNSYLLEDSNGIYPFSYSENEYIFTTINKLYGCKRMVLEIKIFKIFNNNIDNCFFCENWMYASLVQPTILYGYKNIYILVNSKSQNHLIDLIYEEKEKIFIKKEENKYNFTVNCGCIVLKEKYKYYLYLFTDNKNINIINLLNKEVICVIDVNLRVKSVVNLNNDNLFFISFSCDPYFFDIKKYELLDKKNNKQIEIKENSIEIYYNNTSIFLKLAQI